MVLRKSRAVSAFTVNRPKQIFLSAYVDDYKMAGKTENIGPMWATVRKNGSELEESVSLKSNVYLGCAQREIVPDMDLMFAKREMMSRLCDGTGSGKPEGTNIPDLRASVKEFVPNLNASPKTKSNKKKQGALLAKNGLDSSGKCLVTKSGGNLTRKSLLFTAIPVKCSGIATRLLIHILKCLENHVILKN